ncbi:MAG: inositol monophosphatase family protein [Chloroflexota bacterium]
MMALPERLPESTSGRGALDVAIQVVREAGSVLLDHSHNARTVGWKGKSNVVTDADVLAEKVILEALRREFPAHGILAEESGRGGPEAEYAWTVDPLDGTNNFIFGIPFYCVTVALTRGEDVLLGVTYDPLRRELFHAVKGGGAFLNGSPIAVSPREQLEKTLVGFDMGYDPEGGKVILGVAARLWQRVHSLRLLGSAALGLAYVACGRMDIYCHRCLFPWDIAGGMLLVREAGGVVTDWGGVPGTPSTCQLIAANPALHRQFRSMLQGG